MPPDDPLAAGPVGEQSAGSASVTGRCLAAEDRQPITDCVIVIGDTGVEVARSAADGTFRAEVALDSRGGFTLRFDVAGRATRIGEFTAMKEGSREDLGDLLLPRGWQVRGRVTEVDGTGVGGNNVLVFGVDTALREGQSAQGVASAACADDGAFTLDMLLPLGRYHAKVFGSRTQRGDGAFVVDPWSGAAPLQLVLEAAKLTPVIRGMVVDSRSSPIAGVGLRTEAGAVSAQSGLDGCFVLRASGPVTGPTRVLLQHPEQWAPEFAPPEVEWGAENVRIVMPDGPRVAIEVVDDAGVQVLEYAVLLGPADLPFLPAARAAGLHHDTGRCVLSTPRCGEHLLRVVPTAPDLFCSDMRRIELRLQATHTERFVLERLGTAGVVTVDEAGRPVPGADVCLLRLGTNLEWARHREVDPRKLSVHRVTDAMSEVIDRTKTDAEGHASLCSPRLTRGLGLRARAEGFETNLIVDPQVSGSKPLRVVLNRAGALRVEVELNGQARELFSVVLWDGEGEPVRRDGAPIDVDGECMVPMLSAGHYSVSVHRKVVVDVPGQSSWRYAPCGVPVVGVDILGGATASVQIDVPRVALGSLVGRLLGPDALRSSSAPLGVVMVLLSAVDLRIGVFPVAADGSFRADGLLPGQYRVLVQDGGTKAMNNLQGLLEPTVVIEAGVPQTAEFAYVRRRLQVRLRWPDGQPVHGVVEYRCGTLRVADTVAGEVVLDPAPELPIELRAGDAGEWSTPVVMPPGRAEAVVDVVVPKPR